EGGAHRAPRDVAEQLAPVVPLAPALPRDSSRMMLPPSRIAVLAAILLAPAGAAAQTPPPPPPAHHHDHGMPIPMPKGMLMMPGLVGERPPVMPFLPGGGVDITKLPAAKPGEIVKLRDGDTLDLTAMLVRRTIKGRSFAAYGFNGQVPGPLIRVPEKATIVVRFHNRIDMPSTIHWHGVRLDNAFDGVPGLTQ